MANDTHILLVNSDAKIRNLLKNLLTEAGYTRISEVECGISATQVLRTIPIDLLITDIENPGLDGWRLSRLLRSGVLLSNANTPIIMVAETWCERIAETTAREFGINKLIALEHHQQLIEVVKACLKESATVRQNPMALIVEDHSDTANVAKRVLQQRFEVEIAADGPAGLDAWKARRHDLVLLDVMLPVMSGPEVLDEILKIDNHQPVVIMTAHSTMELAESLMLKGAADFITKPFRADQLRRVCELAARREDYLVSNAQFAARVQSLQESTDAFRKVSEAHQRLLDNLSTVVLELDHEGRLRFLNRAWTHLTGFSIAESLDRTLFSFLPTDGLGGRKHCQDWIHRLQVGKSPEGPCELRLIDSQGQFIWVECKLDAIPSEHNGRAIFGCLDDISERKKVQEQLEFLAVHDHLTGLYNRHYFEGTLRQMAASCARGNGNHALLYIDLDHFKAINDTFGHHYGDAILCEISELISSRLRQSDVLCRIGGDEYAVLVTNAEPKQAKVVADQICGLVQGFRSQLGGQQISLSCSIGISAINASAAAPEEYLKQADMAMYVAKRRGRNRIHIYDPEDKESEELRSSLDWVRRLRLAIDEDRLHLHFQPVMHIASGEIAYYEALVRLVSPEREIVMPGEFIPFLELAEEMPVLDHEVIRRAIATLKEYPALNRVAVNLSAQAFRDEKLVPLIEAQLLMEGVAPERLAFELTESASMSDIKATQRMIKRLTDLGCDFAVDDFGTGFSTFGFLKQFPANYIKVDGSFIAHLDKNPVDQILVRAITEVARALGKKTVAEFVENETVLNLIRDIGIDFAQGYHISRPLPVEQLDLSAHGRRRIG